MKMIALLIRIPLEERAKLPAALASEASASEGGFIHA